MRYHHLKIERIQPPRDKYSLLASVFGQEEGLFKSRAWVARITGLDSKYGFKRKFLKPDATDYSASNSKGSRGVYLNYCLAGYGFYEVSEPLSWRDTDRYFLKGDESGLEKVERSIVENFFRD